MRILIAFLTLAALAAAEDFTTDSAKAAKAQYEADLLAAREKYAAALDQAAVKAAELGQLDEVVRIKGEKDRVLGTKAASSEAPPARTLWIKNGDKGFFERLHTGHWIERVSDSRANIYNEVGRTDDYIQISVIGRNMEIRLYNDHFTLRANDQREFRRIIGGYWQQ